MVSLRSILSNVSCNWPDEKCCLCGKSGHTVSLNDYDYYHHLECIKIYPDDFDKTLLAGKIKGFYKTREDAKKRELNFALSTLQEK